MKLRIGDGGSEEEGTGNREIAETGNWRRGLLRQDGGGNRVERELQKIAAVHGVERIDGFVANVIEGAPQREGC